MFERLVYGTSAPVFTIAAFAFAAVIFVAFSWKALRMRGPQVERQENLPFSTATPAARHGKSDDQPPES
jgi:hypothetical protein